MTLDVAQSEENAPTASAMVDAAPLAAKEEHPGMSIPAAIEQAIEPSPKPVQVAPQAPVTGVAGWLVRHPKFTKEPFTYLAYQFTRATIATVPYGFGMAAGHHLFGLMSAKGQKMGYNIDGIKAFTNGIDVVKDGVNTTVKGMAAVEGMAKFELPGRTAAFGRNMARLGNSPLNPAVQIALGFTMFRFTGGIVKNLRDRVMNEKNTPEQTAAEVKHAPKTVWESMKINWPAEATGTPIAALVLGFMNAAYAPTTIPFKRDVSKSFLSQAKEVVFSKPAKLLQNAAVWTVSYSLFFLTAESLFKDKQIQLGKWKGHPNSLKNGPDDTVGGPGAVRYTPPGSDHKSADAPGNGFLPASAEDGYKTPVEDDRAHDSHEKLRYPWLTSEPSMGRFLIRRVAPVAVGISAYAALKRVGYLAEVPFKPLKGLTGQMEPITVPKLEELKVAGDLAKTAGNHGKFFLKNAYREGKATTMFGALWVATDAWGSFYDKFVHNLQKPENAVPLNEHQQDKHAELLARINAKELSSGRAA